MVYKWPYIAPNGSKQPKNNLHGFKAPKLPEANPKRLRNALISLRNSPKPPKTVQNKPNSKTASKHPETTQKSPNMIQNGLKKSQTTLKLPKTTLKAKNGPKTAQNSS
jgi:hypothetical protein